MSAFLNAEQEEAVKAIEGPALVLAGPGTGKTQIIAHRVAEILQSSQLNPKNILCLTFTDAASTALRERLLKIIDKAAYFVRIHTFHSFCHSVIQDFPEHFTFAQGQRPLKEVDQILILQEIIDALHVKSPLKPFGDPYHFRPDIVRTISQFKREDWSPEVVKAAIQKIETFIESKKDILESFSAIHGRSLKEEQVQSFIAEIGTQTPLDFLIKSPNENRTEFKNAVKSWLAEQSSQIPKQKELLSVYRSYQSELKKRGLYDYDDMIVFVLQKFKENSGLLALYQEQFQYILADEYQDTNGAQNELLELLGSAFENPNIFAVGDDKQSIYRFQGASLENLLFFWTRYREFIHVVTLKENYRSSQTILDAADALIKNNESGLASLHPNLYEPLHSQKINQNEKIQIAEFELEETEAYAVAKQIQKLIADGIPANEIAVLYRKHSDIESFIPIFDRLQIPFHLKMKGDVLKNKKIQNLILLLKFIAFPERDDLFFYVLHLDFLNFSALEIAKSTVAAHKDRKSLFEYLSASESPFYSFLTQCSEWQKLSINEPFAIFFDRLIQESGYLASILNSSHKLEELNHLNSLFRELKELNQVRPNQTLKDLIEILEIYENNKIAIEIDPIQTEKEAIQLMTAHGSKGLEFEDVFIIRFTNGSWGNIRNRNKITIPAGLLHFEQVDKDKNEDERRLFYVALTRAKSRVHISHSRRNGNERSLLPSVFLAELPENCIEKISTEDLENQALERLQTIYLKPAQSSNPDYENYIKSLVADWRWNVSKLNNYIECPRKFFYENVLKLQSVKTKHQGFGTAAHYALSELHKNHKKTKTLPSLDFLLDRFENQLKKEILSKKDLISTLEMGRITLTEFYQNFHSQFSPQVESEYDFSAHHVQVEGIPITGKLDKIEILDPALKTVKVVDYKTGNPSKPERWKKGGEYFRQIVFYKLLCDQSSIFPYTMREGAITFLQKDKSKDKFVEVPIQVTAEDLTELKETLKMIHSEVQNAEFLRFSEDRFCQECDYCLHFQSHSSDAEPASELWLEAQDRRVHQSQSQDRSHQSLPGSLDPASASQD